MADFAWVCVNRNGSLMVSTIAPLRADAIKHMVGSEPGIQKRWRYWKRRHGLTCQRVELLPLSDGKGE
jgi:hypothetical protein